jgi:hypothetical protein
MFKVHLSGTQKGEPYVFEIDRDYKDTILVLPDTLDVSTECSWWIAAHYNRDYSKQTSATWTFTTGEDFTGPPWPPFDPGPGDGSSSNALYSQLSWDCFEPDGEDLTFDVWWQPSFSDSSLIGDDITEMTIDPGDLEPDKIYYWKVIASDASGNSTAGPWWRFKTRTASNKPPIEPWGEYPPDDAIGVPLSVRLSWNCSDPEDGPLTYSVTMGAAGGTLTQIASGLTDAFLDADGLDPSAEYEWYVIATDDHSNMTPSPMWSFTTGDGTQTDVYAMMKLKRNITYDGATIYRTDVITARFDSVYGLENYLQPDAVSCGGFDLVWTGDEYSYSDYIAGYFLNPGQTYIFTVTEGGNVPGLVSESIAFPICAPYITSPEAFSYVSMDGFDLEWHTFCSGTIDITIMDLNADSTGVYITTEDDGFYSFTADDLSVIDPMAYQLQIVLIVENRKYITAIGYDPRSMLWARTLATQLVYKQE